MKEKRSLNSTKKSNYQRRAHLGVALDIYNTHRSRKGSQLSTFQHAFKKGLKITRWDNSRH